MGDCDVLDKSLDPYMIYGQYKVGLGPLPETIAVPKSPTIWIWAIILSAVNPMEQLQTEWALTNRSIGEDPVQVFPISISASQQYCYHQSKTEICTSPRRTYQVKMNEILLSLCLHASSNITGGQTGSCHSVQPFTGVLPGQSQKDLICGVRLSSRENQHPLSACCGARHLTTFKDLAHSWNNDLAHPVELGEC